MSIVDESGPRYVRMAHLAIVGSHSTNGVSALHTRILQDVPGIGFTRFKAVDVVRHPMVAKIIEAYEAAEGSDGSNA